MLQTSQPATDRPVGGVEAALARLQRLHPKRIDLSLDRMYRLLAALDQPHRRVAPIIHVAGTNGKGSTVAFLRACLEAAGHRVLAYTSPHLVHFRERIRLADGPIGDDHLVDVLERCETANGGAPITYFEITTCAAFLAFAETPADVLLLETGLGGRLDATNVIDRPAVTAITRISHDHTQFLGDSLSEIGTEKAGILRPGVPAIVAPQRSREALAAVRAYAAEVDAPLLEYGIHWAYRADADGVTLDPGAAPRRLPLPALAGAHQLENAMTAVMCLDRLGGVDLADGAIAAGLRAVDWPARLQPLSRGPLAESLPADWDLWLDGGHNDSAGEALAHWAGGLADRPLHLVVGMLESKDPREFLVPLAPLAAGLSAVAIPDEPASLTADALAAGARAAGVPGAVAAASLHDAIAGLAGRGRPARVLICGSLYLAGKVLMENG